MFDLPEEIAADLLNQELPPGNTISKITKVNLILLLTMVLVYVIYHAHSFFCC